ncbi:MAG: hypothetical protein WC340_06240 [Kiritimatiellia bacterium]
MVIFSKFGVYDNDTLIDFYLTHDKSQLIQTNINIYKLLSLAFAEISGRSYGGGVLKITNVQILKKGYGLTNIEIKLANSIWEKLSSRRLNRGKKKLPVSSSDRQLGCTSLPLFSQN